MRQLAKLVGVHYNTIYDLEKGDEGVTLRIMNKVAAILGVPLSDIFTNDAALPAERIPTELRPLIEPLAPLTFEARLSVVRNIASNLRFMSMLYGGASESLQAGGSNFAATGTTMPELNPQSTDALRDFGVSGGSQSASRGAGVSTGEARRRPRRGHGKAARQGAGTRKD